jgi:hypothetical protein
MVYLLSKALPGSLALCLLCILAVPAADLEILKPGSWAVYKMDIGWRTWPAPPPPRPLPPP